MDTLVQLVPFLLMFGVMYLLIIRPQVKEKEAHDKLVAGLAKDDRVVTSSGLHGSVVLVRDDALQLEIAKGVVVTLEKSAVTKKLVAGDQK